MASDTQIFYIDFGYKSAAEFWKDVVVASYERFMSSATQQHALEASVHVWHFHEWVWHEQNPGADTRNNPDFTDFQTRIVTECPALAWLRDIADASKHRGLARRSREVSRLGARSMTLGAFNTYAFNEMAFNETQHV